MHHIVPMFPHHELEQKILGNANFNLVTTNKWDGKMERALKTTGEEDTSSGEGVEFSYAFCFTQKHWIHAFCCTEILLLITRNVKKYTY